MGLGFQVLILIKEVIGGSADVPSQMQWCCTRTDTHTHIYKEANIYTPIYTYVHAFIHTYILSEHTDPWH